MIFFDLLWLAILVLDIYVIMQIIKGGGDPTKQLIWIVVVLILPIAGPILYYFLIGPGSKQT
jgi:phospholipase D-like protein